MLCAVIRGYLYRGKRLLITINSRTDYRVMSVLIWLTGWADDAFKSFIYDSDVSILSIHLL